MTTFHANGRTYTMALEDFDATLARLTAELADEDHDDTLTVDPNDVRAVLAYAKAARLAQCREYLATVRRALADADPDLVADWGPLTAKLDDLLVDAAAMADPVPVA